MQESKIGGFLDTPSLIIVEKKNYQFPSYVSLQFHGTDAGVLVEYRFDTTPDYRWTEIVRRDLV